jgi:signal transduction histidine kinase
VICTVAHELRTPLQPIFGYLDLLLQDRQKYGITEETGRILDRCLQSAERERQIINRMLEFSILESGKIRPDYAVVSIPSLFSSVIEAGGYLQKAEIATDIPPDLKFEADAGKLTLVIDSLLSNAITYSRPPRRIYIMYTPSPDHRFHSIAIRDNGIGISQTQLESIFEPFQLADSDKLSRKYDRIGLSLSIARKYIDMHGGYITVTSEVNNGSTFTIHLPRERPEGGAGNGA